MSFMFNPYPFEDTSAINRPKLSDNTVNSIVSGIKGTAAGLAEAVEKEITSKGAAAIIGFDGYAGAEWSQTVNLLSQELTMRGISVEKFDLASCWKSPEELDKMLSSNLPADREKDPVLLFGRLFEGGFESLFDAAKLDLLRRRLETVKNESLKKAVIVYGSGACMDGLRGFYNISVYFDVTSKQAILRIKSGRFMNFGDSVARPFKEMMRRCYYFDFELALHLRAGLLRENLIDFYVASDDPRSFQLIPKDAFNEICSSLVACPFRCKPVYIEGVWGGQYIKKLRKLPAEMKNCAWVFDLIPLEVSILVEAGKNLVEIPFFTFACKEGNRLMGKECVKKFKGYFPIRFNYDDSYHSNGNMSIQLHPPDKYIRENFNEHGRQDESYYVVATGHGARTFMGMRDGCNPREFISAVKKSESDHTPVDYEKYINYVESKPGIQFMIPAGTIHSSGRNQVVLEIGSLTVGSYTFKMYDYLRADIDGIPRPIHTYHGEKVLKSDRTGAWVRENIVKEPQLVRKGEGWAEYIVGENDLLYFSLRRYEFEKKIEGDTEGVFHVLTLVDGEKVAVYPKNNPALRYEQNYLDVVVVPADVGSYVVENLGNQPVVVHKTHLKKNFTESL